MALKGVSVKEAVENYFKNDDVRRAVHDISKTANKQQAYDYAAGLFKQDYKFDPAGKASPSAIHKMVDKMLSEPAPKATPNPNLTPDASQKDTVVAAGNGYTYSRTEAKDVWVLNNTHEPELYTKEEAADVAERLRERLEKDFSDEHLDNNPEHDVELAFRKEVNSIRAVPFAEWQKERDNEKNQERPPVTGPAAALFKPLSEAEKGGYETHKVKYDGKTVEAIDFGSFSKSWDSFIPKEREIAHLSCSAALIRDCLNRLDKNPDKDKHVLVLTDKFGKLNDMDWALGTQEGADGTLEPKWNQNGQQIEPDMYSEAKAVELADHFNKLEGFLPEGYRVDVFKADYYLDNRLDLVASELEATTEAVHREYASFGQTRGQMKDIIEGSGAYKGLPVAVQEVLDKKDFERLGIFNNLRNMDFSGYNFSRDLTNVTLNNLSFEGSKLDKVVFGGIFVNNCDFSNCSMVDSKILDGVSEFHGCNFNGADLTRLTVDGSSKLNDLARRIEFDNCDFSNSKMYDSELNQAYFSACNLNGVYMGNCNHHFVTFVKSALSKCDASGGFLEGVEFNSSVVMDTSFKDSTIREPAYGGLCGIEIAGSQFNNVDFSGSEKGLTFEAAYICESVLKDVNFGGARFVFGEVDYDADRNKQDLNIELRGGLRGERENSPEHWRDANSLQLFDDNIFISCNFNKADLSYGVIENCGFDVVEMDKTDLFATTFLNCKFNGMDITNADMRFSMHENGEFKGVNISNTDGSRIVMDNVTFRGEELNNVLMNDAKIVGSDFSGTNVYGGSFENAEIAETDFRIFQGITGGDGKCECNFDGVRIDNIKCSEITAPVCDTAKDVKAIAEKNDILLPSSHFLSLSGVDPDVTNKEFYTKRAAEVVCAAQLKAMDGVAVKDANKTVLLNYDKAGCDCRNLGKMEKVYGDDFLVRGAVSKEKDGSFMVWDIKHRGDVTGRDNDIPVVAYPIAACQSEGSMKKVMKMEPLLRPVMDETGVPVMVTTADGHTVPKLEPIPDAAGKPNLIPSLGKDGKPIYIEVEQKSKTPAKFENIDDAVKFMCERQDMAFLKKVSKSNMVEISNCVEKALNAEKPGKTESKSASITD